MTEKLACVVPFCPHTTTRHPDAAEWICADHWRLVSKLAKLGLRRSREKCLRHPEKHPQRAFYFQLNQKFWGHAKRQAIERAAGITA